MSYCTKADLVARFGEKQILELADRTEPRESDIDGENVTIVINAAIKAAEARIDRWLMFCYKTPLPYTPAVIKEAAIEISRYMLMPNIKLGSKDNSDDHEARRNFTDWEKWFKDICGQPRMTGPNGEVLPYPGPVKPGIVVADRPQLEAPCCEDVSIKLTDCDCK